LVRLLDPPTTVIEDAAPGTTDDTRICLVYDQKKTARANGFGMRGD
jgi:hypothetical protein